MPTSAIYLDPSAGSPSVIEIGGACYSLVGPSSNAPDTSSYDTEYSDCDACLCDCDIDVPFTATGTMTTACPGCMIGVSTVTVSGTGSGGFFGASTRDPSLTCEVDGLGYAWELIATVTCVDGVWTAMLTVIDGCSDSFPVLPGVGSLSCVDGSLSGTVTASGTDVRGNSVSFSFTFG